ncbi:hypothetical protein FKM82_019548 [Ascaphus truei]
MSCNSAWRWVAPAWSDPPLESLLSLQPQRMIPCTLTLLVRAHSTAAVSLTELTANRAKSLPKGPSLKQSQAEGEWGLAGA